MLLVSDFSYFFLSHLYAYTHKQTLISNDVLTGADIASGPVWVEYISFLKSLPVCFVHPTCFVQFLVQNLVSFF